jgi:hypothetical protein
LEEVVFGEATFVHSSHSPPGGRKRNQDDDRDDTGDGLIVSLCSMIDDCELMLMIQVQGVPEAQVEAELCRSPPGDMS